MTIFKFEEGARAHRRKVPRAECPHQEGTREQAEWLAGWDAEEDCEESARAMARLDHERDMEPHTRPRRDGDVTP